jgi:hypothetical protein
MTRQIDSKMMKRAVSQLFDHEVKVHSKCSSHSEIERWIIEGLAPYFDSSSAEALKSLLRESRDLHFDIENDGTVDIECKILKSTYLEHGLHKYDTGYNTTAFRYLTDDECHYVLVTTQDSIGIPANMNVPVTVWLYDDENDRLFVQNFDNSYDLFSDGHINYLLGC